ncbi:hypothetical protein [Microbacterium sp. MYb66]|jgi:hypothetical protein|uniref:hypothetical protein n=1 Tax=Microbacterium sp. MYb66 TaxID=1848692 RepID=UPI000D00D40E|nr:hypothetical protein [Microbacterium sp. MYb66]PRA83126.1 hypothetical protein CQ045_01665 [Microbacterium sp. MYb66]
MSSIAELRIAVQEASISDHSQDAQAGRQVIDDAIFRSLVARETEAIDTTVSGSETNNPQMCTTVAGPTCQNNTVCNCAVGPTFAAEPSAPVTFGWRA